MSEPKNVPLIDLGLPPSLIAKLDPIVDTKGLRSIRPEVLATEWKVTEGQYDRIQKALASRGLGALPTWVAPTPRASRAASLTGRCRDSVVETRPASLTAEGVEPETFQQPCARPLLKGKRACLWHWLLKQPIELQVEWADQRRHLAETAEGYVERARVAPAEWPEGHRWCSDCQMMVPLFYVQGSKCKAHASRASHDGMVQRVYDLAPGEYERLFAWQGGRCYICRQVPRVRRLAVDHDHRTGEVRGLLCANDEWGCNHTLARVLNDVEQAQRLLDYIQAPPIARMRAGDSPVQVSKAAAVRDQAARAPQAPPRDANDPFKGFL